MAGYHDEDPAYPTPPTRIEHPDGSAELHHGAQGATMLDYYARDAMASMLPHDTDHGRYRDAATLRRTAALAFDAAEAMLAERERRLA